MNKLKNNIFFLLLLLCFSCEKHNSDDIKSIYVLYYNYRFKAIADIHCDEIVKRKPTYDTLSIYGSKEVMIDDHGVLDTTLRERKLLNEIKDELARLKPDSIKYFDARISCKITYYNGKNDYLFIGGEYPSDLLYNGQRQKNNRLVFLIKNNIHYYHWLGNESLIRQPELNDRSLKRNSVANRLGFKW